MPNYRINKTLKIYEVDIYESSVIKKVYIIIPNPKKKHKLLKIVNKLLEKSFFITSVLFSQ